MTRGAWILFRSSPSRWIIPAFAAICTVLISPNVRGADTSMQASSEIVLAVLVWMPASVLVAYLDTRASSLEREADLFAADLPGRRRRVLSTMVTGLAWPVLGWVGIWAGGAVLASRNDTPVYPVMVLSGLGLTVIGTMLGTTVAALRAPAWVAAVVAAAAYCGLAVWFYVPDIAISVLFSHYGPLFFSDALPSPVYLVAQAAWATSVLACTTRWLIGHHRVLVTTTALVAAAATTTVLGTHVDYVLTRSGNLDLACKRHREVVLCLWADHEATRDVLVREVDLARSLAPGIPLAAVMTEGDGGDTPRTGLPPHATPRSTVLIRTTRHPLPRSAAAALVAHTFVAPPACPGLRSTLQTGELPIAALVEEVVLAGRVDATSTTPDDPRLVGWLSRTRAAVAHCRPPELP